MKKIGMVVAGLVTVAVVNAGSFGESFGGSFLGSTLSNVVTHPRESKTHVVERSSDSGAFDEARRARREAQAAQDDLRRVTKKFDEVIDDLRREIKKLNERLDNKMPKNGGKGGSWLGG